MVLGYNTRFLNLFFEIDIYIIGPNLQFGLLSEVSSCPLKNLTEGSLWFMNINRSNVVNRPLLACCEQLYPMLFTQLNFVLVTWQRGLSLVTS